MFTILNRVVVEILVLLPKSEFLKKQQSTTHERDPEIQKSEFLKNNNLQNMREREREHKLTLVLTMLASATRKPYIDMDLYMYCTHT